MKLIGIMRNFIFLYLILSTSVSYSYVFNRGTDGSIVGWDNFVNSLNIEIHGTNSSSLSTNEIQSQLQSSLNQWNGKSRIGLSSSIGSGNNRLGVNDLYFSNSSLFFNGAGIIAITQVSYDERTGKIQEADIILNDNLNFSTNTNSSIYIGDVLSHELGHFLGLSHSQLHGATMSFELQNGQDTISEDEEAGVHTHYPISNSLGTLRGKIIGGKNITGIFGVQVRAISTKTGRVVAGVISEIDGSFKISGLPIDDQYYLYTSPTQAITSLPSYYSEIKNNFCDSGKSFRGSFFQGCSSRQTGYPQAISLSSSNRDVNIGNITIRCGLDVPNNYLANKLSATSTNINSASTSSNGQVLNVGNAFVGFYTSSQVKSRDQDLFKIDLSHYNLNSFAHLSGRDLYLDIKLISQQLYSQIQLDLEVTPFGQSPLEFKFDDVSKVVATDSDGNPNIEITARVPLDELTSANNIFDLVITPRSITQFRSDANFSVTNDDLFPSGANHFNDDQIFYLAIISLSEKVGGGFQTISMADPGKLEDNSTCPDGINSFGVAANVSDVAQSRGGGNQEDLLACGSVALLDNKSPPSNGPFNILLGFCIVMFLSRFSRFSRT